DDEIEPSTRKVLDAVALPSDGDFLNLDVHNMSGGMAKRLGLARALAMNP
ncbi:MAG: ABC transporter, partial [Rhodospirillaceae bacterium]|nr:ABC transporter [Rhodospirillaceae bacterium]